MRPYIHLLSTVHLVLAGDLATATAAVSDFRPLVDPWTTLPEESEFHVKLSLASPAASPTANPTANPTCDLRMLWMSRRQFIMLAYLVSGLSLKPATNADLGTNFLRESTKGAIENFRTQYAGRFLLGLTARRQLFYVCALILCRLHLAELYIAREDFGQAHEAVAIAAEVCARNDQWNRFGPLILHVKGMLAQAQGKFPTSFAMYKAALKSTQDIGLKLAVTLNAFTLTLSRHTNSDPRVAALFASIQAATSEPRLHPIEAALSLLAVVFTQGMVGKKNYLARAVKFAKASTNSQILGLCNVLTGVLYAATQPDVTTQILTRATANYRKLGCDIGSIMAISFARKLLEATRDDAALLANTRLLEECKRSYLEKCSLGEE